MAISNEQTKGLASKLWDNLIIPTGFKEDFISRVAGLFSEDGAVFNKNITGVWGRTVYDSNPLHEDENYAKSLGMGFETTPVFGTLISSSGELLVNKLADEISSANKTKVFYSGNRIKYEEPLYPGELLTWELGNVLTIDKENPVDKRKTVFGFDVVLYGKSGDKKVIQNTARFRFGKNKFDAEEIEKINTKDESSIVADYVFDFDSQRHKDYNDCIGNSVNGDGEGVLWMAPAAMIPAGLLKLSEEKTGKYEGTYRAMDLDFYSGPQAGKFRTVIQNATAPKEGGGRFVYNFKGTVLQGNTPILSGSFKCISPSSLSN